MSAKKGKMKLPLQPQLPTTLTLMENIIFDEQMQLSHVKLQGELMEMLMVRNLAISHASLEKVVGIQGQLDSMELDNVVLRGCDFSNSEWLYGSFRRVHFQNCKFIGTNFAESYWQDCRFTDCLMDFSSFNYNQLKTVAFEQCSLKNSEFSEVKWQHLTFDHCRLNKTSWLHTPLKKLNLANSEFEQFAFSPEQLAGLILNQEQAIMIALSLGIELAEDV